MGSILFALGMLSYLVAGLLGLIVCLRILADIGGVLLAVVGFFIFPAALGIAPFIPLFTSGDWVPLAIVYGGGVAGRVLTGVGSALSERAGK